MARLELNEHGHYVDMDKQQPTLEAGKNSDVLDNPVSGRYTTEEQAEKTRKFFETHPVPSFNSENTPPPTSPSKRKLSRIGIAGAGALALAIAFGLGYATDGKLPGTAQASPTPTSGETVNTPKPSESGATPTPAQSEPTPTAEVAVPTQTPEVIKTGGQMVLSEEEQSFKEQMLGYLSWAPDGPITYWTTAEGKRRYLLTGGQENATYMLETDGQKSLKDIMASGEINADSFKKVYGPDQNVQYRREYAGITSVLQIDKSNPNHLLGIAHCEERTDRNASGDYTATIGLTESFDGGLTWQDKGPLITGTDVKAPGGGGVSGAGQPTAFYNENDGYAYIMYIDWSAQGQHLDQLYMARAKANDNGSLGQIEYYTDTGFSTQKDLLKAVIPVPSGGNLISKDFPSGYIYLDKHYDEFPLQDGSDLNLVYTALPHISWNIDLNEFIAEGESDTSFWTSTSSDLLNWTEPEIVYDFIKYGGKPHSVLRPGEKWYSYPTALSENEPNSQITDETGIFYHSSGNNLTPHEPATVSFEIK